MSGIGGKRVSFRKVSFSHKEIDDLDATKQQIDNADAAHTCQGDHRLSFPAAYPIRLQAVETATADHAVQGQGSEGEAKQDGAYGGRL